MLLGALAPDAHTEAQGYDRTWLHPAQGVDATAFVIARLRPPRTWEQDEGRAFGLAVLEHLVADELFRTGPPLPQGVATGLIPHHRGELDLPALREELEAASARFGLHPLTAEQIIAKGATVLGRPPLSEATGPYLMLPELAQAMHAVVSRTLWLGQGSPLLPAE